MAVLKVLVCLVIFCCTIGLHAHSHDFACKFAKFCVNTQNFAQILHIVFSCAHVVCVNLSCGWFVLHSFTFRILSFVISCSSWNIFVNNTTTQICEHE